MPPSLTSPDMCIVPRSCAATPHLCCRHRVCRTVFTTSARRYEYLSCGLLDDRTELVTSSPQSDPLVRELLAYSDGVLEALDMREGAFCLEMKVRTLYYYWTICSK